MNQMLEAWKGIPDLSDDGSPLPVSNSSSKGIFTSFSPYLFSNVVRLTVLFHLNCLWCILSSSGSFLVRRLNSSWYTLSAS